MIECKIEPVGTSGKYVSVSLKIDDTTIISCKLFLGHPPRRTSELEKVSQQLENEMENQEEIELCEECNTYPKDHPSNLCVGCNEYKNHF